MQFTCWFMPWMEQMTKEINEALDKRRENNKMKIHRGKVIEEEIG